MTTPRLPHLGDGGNHTFAAITGHEPPSLDAVLGAHAQRLSDVADRLDTVADRRRAPQLGGDDRLRAVLADHASVGVGYLKSAGPVERIPHDPREAAVSALDALLRFQPRHDGGNRDIAAIPLLQQDMRLVVPAGHRLAARKSVRLADAASEDFVALREEYGTRQIADALCRAAGFTARIGVVADAIDTARGLVAAGLGIALLPDGGAPRDGTAEIPLAHAPGEVAGVSRTLALAWPAHTIQPAAVALFRGFLTARRGRLAATTGPGGPDASAAGHRE